jgi:hypothetical protein
MFNICNIYLNKQLETQEKNIIDKCAPDKCAPDKCAMEKRLITQVQTQIKTKLISSYEEDYTRNNTEIMKLWQRN